MTHFPIVALRRRLNSRQISLGRLVPVLLSALALVTTAPAAWAALTPTTTTLLTAPDNPNSGAVITLTAQVLATEYTVAGGTVSFTDTYNGVSEVLGTVQVQSTNGNAGTAILKTEVGGVGTHQFQAIFSGTSFFATSSSPAQSVPFVIPYASATALTTTGTAPGPYSFTGTVSAFGPSGPTGTVTFTDTTSNFVLGSATLNPATLQNGFTAPTNYPIAGMNNGNTGGTNGPAEGDFNGDGRPDFAVPTNTGPIVILLGKGDGTFTNGTSLTPAAGFESTAVVVGDYNQDGKQDLAVLSASGPGSIGNINIYLGNGDGTFQAPLNFPVAATGTGVTGSRLMASGDFNRDGVADLVVTNSVTNTVSILLGIGNGTFQAAVPYTVGVAPWNVVVGDINHDGFLDLAVASDSTGSVSILQGNGDGTFKPFTAVPMGSSQVGSVAIADFNHDGFLDLAVTSAPDNSVFVALNQGTATPTFATPVKYAMTGGPYYLTIGDFNRDGNPDIISANGNSVGILLGSATGVFQAATYYTVPNPAIFATVGDINGDDRVDITAVTSVGMTVLLSGQSESASISNITINGCTTTPQNVVASYAGDTNYGSSTSAPQTFTGNAQATKLVLTVTPANNFVGQQVTLQATLTPSAYGSTTTNGEMVTFKNGATVLGQVPLSSGVAVLNTSFAFATSESFTATYGGDCAFTGSTSNTVAGSTLNPSVLTWNTPVAITYPTPLSSVQLNATDTVAGAPLAGIFTYNPAAGTVLTAGTHTLSVTFVPTDPTYATQSTTVQIVVNQGTPVIIWPTPTPISYGTPLNGFQLDATATSGTVSVPLPYNVYGIYSPGSTYPQANSFDNDGYSYSTTTLGSTVVWNGLTFNMGPANAPDAVATPTGAASGLVIPLPAGTFTDLFMLGAMVNNINANQTFIVTYTDNSTTVFNQNMSDWFNAAGWPGEAVVNCSEKRNFDDGSTQPDSVCVFGYDIPLNVNKTVKSITLPNTRNIVMLSMDLQTPQIPGSFVYNPPSGTIEPVGNADPLQVSFTPTDTLDYTSANDEVFLQVVAPATTTTPTISWPTPAPITYGTPLSSTQLDAVAMAQAQPTPVVPNSQLLVVSTATDGTPFGLAGFDNAGDAYSYNQLNLGTPATAGQVNYQGTTFTLGQPTVPNAITNGAVYTLTQPGNYSSVYLIGAAAGIVENGNKGNAPGAAFLLTYSTGKAVTETVDMSAWNRTGGGTFGDETVVATTNHANTQGGGSNPGTYRLYGYQITADPTRTLVSVTLPADRNVVIMSLGFGTNNQVVVPGTYTYTYQPGNQSAPGAILPVGTTTLDVAFTPNNSAGYTSAKGSTTILVNKATPIINWPTPDAIPTGTPLTGTQLDATATFQGSTLPGTYRYTVVGRPGTAGGQVLPAGTYTLQVVFRVTGPLAGDFNTATATVQLVVGTTGATGIGGTAGYPTDECCYFSQPTPYTVNVNGNNAAPTGTVTVTFAGQTLGTGTLVPGSGSNSSALLSLNSFYFSPGENTVTINYSGDTNYVANSNTTQQISLLNPVFGAQTTTVLSTPTTLNVPYTFTQAGTLSYNYSPVNGSIKDFSDNGVQCYEGSTPTALANQPLPQGTLCIFSVSFTPQLPGIRKGAIQIDFTPSGGTAEPHLYAFLSGLGAASQISLSSAQTVVLNNALLQPQSLAFDPNDYHNSSLYIGNGTYTTSTPNAGQIDKLSSGTLSTWVPASPTTVVYPSDLTFDAFGNLVVTDANAATVVSFSPTKVATPVPTTGFTLTLPLAAANDFGGNMYIADAAATGRVIMLPGETFASYKPSLLNLGASVLFPQGLAVDNAGANLYVADGGTYASPSTTSQIVQVPLSGAGGTAISLSPCDGTVSPCSFNSPAGMAFDPNGDLFFTDSGPRVLMVPANHSATNETTQLSFTGLVNPTGIALDGSGDVYVTDLNGTVNELMVNAGVMSFKTANSSLTTTITNTGNLPLQNITITAPTSPFSITKDGCSGTTVPAGGKCSLTYAYTTSATQVSSTVTIKSNAYTANGVTITLQNF